MFVGSLLHGDRKIVFAPFDLSGVRHCSLKDDVNNYTDDHMPAIFILIIFDLRYLHFKRIVETSDPSVLV